MATVAFSGGATLGAAGDTYPVDTHGSTVGDIIVNLIVIEKDTGAGQVTLKDGSGNIIHVTESLSATETDSNHNKYIEFPGGWRTNGVELDNVGGGAVVRLFVAKGTVGK
jgi:hypothetical protein